MEFSDLQESFDTLNDPDRVLLTGTRAYGPVTEDSDYDVVMLYQDAKAICNLLMLLNVKMIDSRHIDPAYKGFYFKLNELEKVQIIVADTEQEFAAWKRATERMKKEPPIEDREKRIECFKSLFHILLDAKR